MSPQLLLAGKKMLKLLLISVSNKSVFFSNCLLKASETLQAAVDVSDPCTSAVFKDF